jgi:hypothetical protein
MKKSVYAVSLVLFLAIAMALPALAATSYLQGFEIDTVEWTGSVTRVASGDSGVTSAAGDFHALAAGGPFTRFGGYESTFPNGGYTTSIDVYLNVEGTYTNDTRFDWTSAINDSTGGHRRDFVFNVGFYDDTAAPGSGPRFVISASNNAGRGSSFPKNPGREPFSITETGWYTFEHNFTDNGGVLSVVLRIRKNGELKTWTLSDPNDLISGIGGHRYGWFATEEFSTLAIDNVRLSSPFNFTGFFEPVNNGGIVNTVKAGSSIPIKFSLGGDQGLAILDGNPQVQFVSCGSAPTDAIEETVPAASHSGLTYDPVTYQYTYVWKTDKSWKGDCGRLVLNFADGSTQSALFSFK